MDTLTIYSELNLMQQNIYAAQLASILQD